MTTKNLEFFELHLAKDAPLRKPTPIYFGLCRTKPGGSVCGAYLRLGTRCLFVTVR